MPRNEKKKIEQEADGNITVEEIFEAYGIREEEESQPVVSRSSTEGVGKNKKEPPSLWDYDRRCLAKEFVGLDQGTFLADPFRKNLCFLETDVLIKICKMVSHFSKCFSIEVSFQLSVFDFLELSLTCRFMHWRMFTFCKCHAPYTAVMTVSDSLLTGENAYPKMPETVYFFDGDASSYDGSLTEESKDYLFQERGYRGIFVHQPRCLGKPFYFRSIELQLTVRLHTHFV